MPEPALAARAPALGRPRPLSPHLGIWRWRVHMAVSILHRTTGNIMAFGAAGLFTWWLLALASGPDAYGTWYRIASGPVGMVIGVGFTWVLFQHMASGLRHLIMDTGAALEIHDSRRLAMGTFAFSFGLTLIVWAYILFVRG